MTGPVTPAASSHPATDDSAQEPAHAIYLDHNATAPLDPEVLDAMMPFLVSHHGNAISGHSFGRLAGQALETAREQVADLLDASPDELVFNSGGSEGLNHAIKGLVFARKGGPRRILFGATEHHAVEDATRWCERFGIMAEPLPVDRHGIITPEALIRALKMGPALLVAVMWANNEVGSLQPIAALSEICRQEGISLLCDAVQAAGKVPVSSRGLDLLAISGHKLYGPKGVGALFVRRGLVLEPLIHGASQEAGRRAGTHAVAQIVGLGAAAALASRTLAEEGIRQGMLRDAFEAVLLKHVPGTHVHGKQAPRLPNTSCLSFDGIVAWELQEALDAEGVAISAGAACRSGLPKPSPVLKAMGVNDALANGGVRFSLGRHTTEADMREVVARVIRAVKGLRDARNARWLTEGLASAAGKSRG